MKVVWAFVILIQQQHLKLRKLIHKYKTFCMYAFFVIVCIVIFCIVFSLFHLKSSLWNKQCQNSPFLTDDKRLSYIYYPSIYLNVLCYNKQLQKTPQQGCHTFIFFRFLLHFLHWFQVNFNIGHTRRPNYSVCIKKKKWTSKTFSSLFLVLVFQLFVVTEFVLFKTDDGYYFVVYDKM